MITADDKITALKSNYDDPFVDIITKVRNEEDEVENVLRPYEAPSQVESAASKVAPNLELKEKSW